jgi:hypothetical protein
VSDLAVTSRLLESLLANLVQLKWPSVTRGARKLRLFPAPFQKSVVATSQFIGYQAGNGVDGGGHRFRLGLLQARFQHRSDAAETQLP